MSLNKNWLLLTFAHKMLYKFFSVVLKPYVVWGTLFCTLIFQQAKYKALFHPRWAAFPFLNAPSGFCPLPFQVHSWNVLLNHLSFGSNANLFLKIPLAQEGMKFFLGRVKPCATSKTCVINFLLESSRLIFNCLLDIYTYIAHRRFKKIILRINSAIPQDFSSPTVLHVRKWHLLPPSCLS